MAGDRPVKLIHKAVVDGTRGSGRLLTGWLDGARKIFSEKWIEIQQTEMCAKNCA